MDINQVARSCLPRALAQDTVVMAVLPDGREYKVTGHKRARRWSAEPATAPKTVRVIVVPVANEEVSGRLYDALEHFLGPDLM